MIILFFKIKSCFGLFFCLLSLLLGSCDKNVDDFYPPYNYNYYIAFVDESGKDLLEGISTTLSDTKLPILEKGTYSYVFIPPNSKDQFTFSGIIELENVKGHNALGIHLGMADWHLHKKPEVITHNFASSFIFCNSMTILADLNTITVTQGSKKSIIFIFL